MESLGSFAKRARAKAIRVVAARANAALPPSGGDSPAAPPATMPGAGTPAAPNILDVYTSEVPSAQLALDVFAGEWSSTFPPELGVHAGGAQLFADSRITRTLEWLGRAVTGLQVLELGPLEGGHTYMLDRAGAEVFAIEANSRAFLKCLIAKEVLAMRSARFARGDFVAYLRESRTRYDLVLASGVLYHMVDPLDLLTLLAAASDRLAIWTHYYDPEVLLGSPLARQFEGAAYPVAFEDATYTLHPRDYLEALSWGGFCGGPETYARWMERADILDALARLGFGDVEISHDAPDHPNGPSFLLLARR